MKKIRINGKEDVSILEEEFNTGILTDECLMKCHKSLISPGTELSRAYALKEGAQYPVYPGYCAVGTVLDVGAALKDIEIGQRYLYSAPHASQHHFNQLRSDGGVMFKLNDKTTDEEGCFIMMMWIAMNGILPVDVKMTDKVGIFGLGNLGLILALLYRHMGCEVYAIDISKKRCEKARKLGIPHVIDVEADKQEIVIKEITMNQGLDIVVDASGLSKCIETCINVASKYATVVLLGSPREEYNCNATLMLNSIHTKMLNIVGGFNRRYPFQEEIGSKISMEKTMRYLENLLNEKVINVQDFITHQIKPEQIMEAYEGLMYDKDNYLTVVINWNEEKI